MQAMRVFTEPRDHQVVIDLPPDLRTAVRLEVIVLSADAEGPAGQAPAADGDQPTNPVRRRPSARLAATRVIGDLLAPAAPDAEWSVLQ